MANAQLISCKTPTEEKLLHELGEVYKAYQKTFVKYAAALKTGSGPP